MPKKKVDVDGSEVHFVQAPHQIAVMIDGVVQDVMGMPDRSAAIHLSEPTFAYFNGASLPKDSEGRNVIGQTRLDIETNEWVHTELDGTERREPVGKSPWDVEDDE